MQTTAAPHTTSSFDLTRTHVGEEFADGLAVVGTGVLDCLYGELWLVGFRRTGRPVNVCLHARGNVICHGRFD